MPSSGYPSKPAGSAHCSTTPCTGSVPAGTSLRSTRRATAPCTAPASIPTRTCATSFPTPIPTVTCPSTPTPRAPCSRACRPPRPMRSGWGSSSAASWPTEAYLRAVRRRREGRVAVRFVAVLHALLRGAVGGPVYLRAGLDAVLERAGGGRRSGVWGFRRSGGQAASASPTELRGSGIQAFRRTGGGGRRPRGRGDGLVDRERAL